MTAPYLLWAVLACTLFWCVGVYNRVMRLRARGLDAFGSVEKHVRHYPDILSMGVDAHDAVDNGAASADRPLAVGSDLEHLMARVQALDLALKHARASSLERVAMSNVSIAYADLAAAWLLLKSAPADLAGPAMPEELERQWEEHDYRVRSAMAGFNQIIQKYNDAISQFPARHICGQFGFHPISFL